jgi:hypothetical protein
MKVEEVLRRWPKLLEVFLEASPAFQRLKNPLLRRTMPRLVTVAQAARIGGLEPEELVARLNRALGVEAAPKGGGEGAESLLGTPPPAWLSAPVGFHLDVRPVLEAGGEPFQRIMAAAKEVEPGKRLVLEVLFEPVPLYRVLARQGFLAWCERVREGHYRAHFYRQGVGGGKEGEGRAAALTEADWEDFQAEVFVEENLEPPLPMMRVPGNPEAWGKASRPPGAPPHPPPGPPGGGRARLRPALKDLGPGQVKLLIRKGG